MITTEVKQKPQQPDYPCLMIDNIGSIVLMVLPGLGTIISPERNRYFGEFRDDFVMDLFIKFEGILTLRNEP